MNQIHIDDYIRHKGDLDTYWGFSGANTQVFYAGGSHRMSITGDVHIEGTTDLNINGASRRLNFTSGSGTIRTTTGNSLILQTDNSDGIVIDGSTQSATFGASVYVPEYIYHTGNTNTNIRYENSQVTIATSGGSHIQINNDENIYFRTNGTNRFKMDTSGNFIATADIIAYGSVSDVSYKENIKPITGALNLVDKLQGVTFDWKKDTDTNKMVGIKEDIGFIAQDVEKVLPTLVRENENGKLSIRDKGIVPVLVEAIKELKAEIEELKKQIK